MKSMHAHAAQRIHWREEENRKHGHQVCEMTERNTHKAVSVRERDADVDSTHGRIVDGFDRSLEDDLVDDESDRQSQEADDGEDRSEGVGAATGKESKEGGEGGSEGSDHDEVRRRASEVAEVCEGTISGRKSSVHESSTHNHRQ